MFRKITRSLDPGDKQFSSNAKKMNMSNFAAYTPDFESCWVFEFLEV